MAHKTKTQKYPVDTTCQDVSCLLLWFKSLWKKVRFKLVLNKTFCLTPRSLIHRRLKHHQKTEINKTMLSAFPSLVFNTKFTISEFEKQISIPFYQ